MIVEDTKSVTITLTQDEILEAVKQYVWDSDDGVEVPDDAVLTFWADHGPYMQNPFKLEVRYGS